jgi:hypothetical protein
LEEQTLEESKTLITPEELANRLQLAHKTILNRLGKLGPPDGVFRWGPHITRIDWVIFRQRLAEGKLGQR